MLLTKHAGATCAIPRNWPRRGSKLSMHRQVRGPGWKLSRVFSIAEEGLIWSDVFCVMENCPYPLRFAFGTKMHAVSPWTHYYVERSIWRFCFPSLAPISASRLNVPIGWCVIFSD